MSSLPPRPTFPSSLIRLMMIGLTLVFTAIQPAASKPRGRTSKARTAAIDTPAPTKAEAPKAAALADSEPASTAGSSEAEDDGEPRRGGWWQRTFG